MTKRRFIRVLLCAVPVLTRMALAQTANSNRAPNTSEQSAALAAIREYALTALIDGTCLRPSRAVNSAISWRGSSIPRLRPSSAGSAGL